MTKLSIMVDSLSAGYTRRTMRSGGLGVLQRSKSQDLQVLNQVSFTAYEGDIIGVMGRNGAGKSTLFDALANRVSYEGRVRMWSEPRLIKLERSLPLTFSGRQHIELIVSSLFRDSDEAKANTESAIAFSELDSAIDAPMRSYSKGMRTRVTFSALTVGQPKVLLIDEALAVGDRNFTRKAMKRMRELSTQSTTVLICDHSLRRLNWLCNRGLVVGGGSILADAPIKEAMERYTASMERSREPAIDLASTVTVSS